MNPHIRSKEKLEIEKGNIIYYEIVKKAIYKLYPLRTEKKKTFNYFSRYLFADQRYSSLRNNPDEDSSKVEFQLRKDEVDQAVAYKVRMEILSVIINDPTFIFANNIIVQNDNIYTDNQTLARYKIRSVSAETVTNIKTLIANYKEDYPKTNLCKYLTNRDNNEYYTSHVFDLPKSDKWWLEAFNLSYKFFDELRVTISGPNDAFTFIENIDTGDELLNKTVKEIVLYMSENYHYYSTKEQAIMFSIFNNMLKNSFKKTVDKSDVIAEEGKDNFYKSLTCSQLTKMFVLILNEAGISFENTDKLKIARFIHTVTGKNLQNIRTRMDINYENDNDTKDLIIIADVLIEIMPKLSDKIKKSISLDIY